jgi:4'-phosphopantetheinyl transferase
MNQAQQSQLLSFRSPRDSAVRAEWPSADEVHLYGANLEAFQPNLNPLAILSGDEWRRADRLKFERDRRRFVAGRAFLRDALSRYVGERADRLRFRYGTNGKPELTGRASALRFSLSHSDNWAVLGVAMRDVGVDVEQVKFVPDVEEIAQEFFVPEDAAFVLMAKGAERLSRFYQCWTRKEALLKAHGLGLGDAVRGLDRAEWSLLAANIQDDLIVSVAIRHSNARIVVREWGAS